LPLFYHSLSVVTHIQSYSVVQLLKHPTFSFVQQQSGALLPITVHVLQENGCFSSHAVVFS